MITLGSQKSMKTDSPFRSDNIEFLFKEHYNLLCLVCFAILKDREASKDVVQDFFLSYWQKRNSISIKVSFCAYAVKSGKNLSLLVVKKDIKEKSLFEDLLIQEYDNQNYLQSVPI